MINNDHKKTKAQLIEELNALRRENAQLKQSRRSPKHTSRRPVLSTPYANLEILESYEILLTDIQRLAKVGHWHWNKATNEVWWSDELKRIYGVPLDQAIDFDFYVSLLHPSDKARVLHEIQQALLGDPFANEQRTYLPDGRIRYIQVQGEVITDGEGAVIGMKGISLDITERKEIEQKLLQANLHLEAVVEKQSLELDTSYSYLLQGLSQHQALQTTLNLTEKNYKHLIEAASEGIWQSDSQGNTVLVNPAMAKILGYSMAEIQTKRFRDVIDPKSLDALNLPCSGQTEECVHRQDCQLYHQDGSVLWAMVSATPIFDEKKQYLGSLQMVTDITQRRQTESALKEFNRRWRSLLDQVQMLVVEVDQDGKIRYVNPFFEKIAQVSLQALIGKSWFDIFVSPRSRMNSQSSFKQALETQLPGYLEDIMKIPSGEERIIGWHNTVLKNTQGKSIGAIGIGQDITERYHLEQLKSEFISIVSHELRTPLTYLQSSLSLLLNDSNLRLSPQEINIVTGIAMQGIDRLVRLVNDILDLERLESVHVVLKKEECNPQVIVEAAIADLENMAKQSQITLKTSVIAHPVWADPRRLIQILTNLISNAIKFSEPNSTVEVTVTLETQAQPDNQKANVLLFRIADQGKGITSQQLDIIFNRFHQADSSDIRDKQGSGLGLAICRNLVHSHGGQIWAESTVGQGSIFYFTLSLNTSNDDH